MRHTSDQTLITNPLPEIIIGYAAGIDILDDVPDDRFEAYIESKDHYLWRRITGYSAATDPAIKSFKDKCRLQQLPEQIHAHHLAVFAASITYYDGITVKYVRTNGHHYLVFPAMMTWQTTYGDRCSSPETISELFAKRIGELIGNQVICPCRMMTLKPEYI